MASLEHGARTCVFRCNPEADDSLEHYCRCDFVRKFAAGYGGLRTDDFDPYDFFLLREGVSDEALARMAVVHYCAFTYFLMVKHGTAGAGALEGAERFKCMRRLIFKVADGNGDGGCDGGCVSG